MKDKQLKKIDLLVQDCLLEHKKQIAKWGVQNRTSFEWLAYLTEEVGEVAQAISEYEYRVGLSQAIYWEAIQVATLALKIAEMSEDLNYVGFEGSSEKG